MYKPTAGIYTITAAGANLWSTADAFHFVWKKVSGDVSMDDKKVRVRVNIVGGAGTMNVPSWASDSHHLAFVSYQMLPVEDEEKD